MLDGGDGLQGGEIVEVLESNANWTIVENSNCLQLKDFVSQTCTRKSFDQLVFSDLGLQSSLDPKISPSAPAPAYFTTIIHSSPQPLEYHK